MAVTSGIRILITAFTLRYSLGDFTGLSCAQQIRPLGSKLLPHTLDEAAKGFRRAERRGWA
jgi:hypothetical protein